MEIKKLVRCFNDELIELRRDFHRHPELGLEEFRTADKVSTYLGNLGLEVNRLTETGVAALLKGAQPGPTLMLRADMDALPVEEETTVSYKSVHKGKMHACGHDGHTAMLLVAAKILCRYKAQIKGNIKFLFQPNEEEMYADVLIEKGVLENPRVDAALGIHLISLIPKGRIGISAGAVMCGMHTFKLTVIGKGGHTGFPQESIDPILTAANIIQTVQTAQTREIDVLKPTLIIFGKISGGTICNIIPDTVEMEGTIRYLYDAEAGDERPIQRFERIIKNVCAAHGAEYELTFPYNHPAVINDPEMTSLVSATAEKILESKENIFPFRTLIGEDFSMYGRAVPSAFYFVGAGNKEKDAAYPHHSPLFNIDEESLAIGVEMHVRSALSYFESVSK